MSKSV